MPETREGLGHRWQDFRIRCLKLAVKAGATDQNIIELADKLGSYILTRSEREIESTKATFDSNNNGEA